MSAEPPPTYNTSIFNQAYWGISTAGTLDDRYLQFPTGQGTETLPALVVTGTVNLAYIKPSLYSTPAFTTGMIGHTASATSGINPYTSGNNGDSVSLSLTPGSYIFTCNVLIYNVAPESFEIYLMKSPSTAIRQIDFYFKNPGAGINQQITEPHIVTSASSYFTRVKILSPSASVYVVILTVSATRIA